jgi:hypothetical protein
MLCHYSPAGIVLCIFMVLFCVVWRGFNLHDNIVYIGYSQFLFHVLAIALLFMVPVAMIFTDNHSVYLFIYITVFDTVKSDCMEY